MAQLDEILRAAVAAGASDVHLHAGATPLFRVNTIVQPSAMPALSRDALTTLARQMLGEARWRELETHRDADFAFELTGVARFRVNAHFQRGNVALAIRVIAGRVRPLEQLFLPDIVQRIATLPRGLVLVTGTAGSGKSTTLAAMIDAIIRRSGSEASAGKHVVTLEDPIEFSFNRSGSFVEQREIGTDVPSFAAGLRHALRQDPDVIFVGEMRDLETTSAAVTAAETGHFVLSTLHTQSAPQTIDRIVDIYPAGQQNQIRSMLAGTLAAVISQRLFKRQDQPGMIPAAEVMLCTPAVRNCIRENRTFEIPNLIATNRAAGMQTMDDSVRELMENGYISREDAAGAGAKPDQLGLARVA